MSESIVKHGQPDGAWFEAVQGEITRALEVHDEDDAAGELAMALGQRCGDLRYRAKRAEQLRQQAEAQCERRAAERDEALARAREMERSAAYGRALLELMHQLRRLRETHCRTMGFDFSADGVARSVADELAELACEDVGSPRARAETTDVLATTLQLLDSHGTPLLDGMLAAADKLRRRLDHVDAGGTWEGAKAAERAAAEVPHG